MKICCTHQFARHLLHFILNLLGPSCVWKRPNKRIEFVDSGLEFLEQRIGHGGRKKTMIDRCAAPQRTSFGHQKRTYRMTADSHMLSREEMISVRLFCPRKSKESEYFSNICKYSYILRHMHSQQLYTNSETFRHPSHCFSTWMPTISEYFITYLCTISTHFRIFNAISIRHSNICRTFGNTWTPVPSILQDS